MMGEEDHNSENIRKESKELSNIRKEQQRIKFWGGALLGANLLLLAGFLWISGRDQGTKQPVPTETDFQYPPPAPPAEEDTSIWVTGKISDEASNTDNTDEMDNVYADTAADSTDYMDYMDETEETNNVDNAEESLLQTESTSPAAPVAVTPAITRPVTIRPTAARTVKKVVQPRRKKTATVIPASIITRPGMTLCSLARLYYGREVFWVYIYDRNRRVLSSLDTSSSDALPSGIELELPRPADYGIDATEPISLQRACNLAKSLSKQ